MNLINELESEEISRLGKNVPVFNSGDTVIVNVNVIEGDRKESKPMRALLSQSEIEVKFLFVVRKISAGEELRGLSSLFSAHSKYRSQKVWRCA